MDEPISPAMDRSQASLIELLIAHSHETTGNAPTLQYLTEETFTFIDAGVDTSGRTIAAAIYYIIRNPVVQQRLRAELDEAPVTAPDATSVHVKLLSTLPYLVSRLLMARPGESLIITERRHQRDPSYVARSAGPSASNRSCAGIDSREALCTRGREAVQSTPSPPLSTTWLSVSGIDRGVLIKLRPPFQRDHFPAAP
jgi:hypothetical protein